MLDLDHLDEDLKSPYTWGVPHPTWRPNQYDALMQTVELLKLESDRPTAIFQLPTGSGKSSIPTALAKQDKVVVFVHSLALLDQYEEKYNFTIVKGMAQYVCINQKVVTAFREKYRWAPTVAECPFDEKSECPQADKCLYIVAREKALASRRMACTYPFALLSFKVQLRGGICVLDEAHSSVESVIQLSTIKFSDKFRNDWSLPAFPIKKMQRAFTRRSRGKILTWLNDSLKLMYDNRPSSLFVEDLALWTKARNKINFAIQAIDTQDPWYLQCGTEEKERTFGKGRWKRKQKVQEPYFLTRPFSASLLSWKLFKSKSLGVLMSATIGDDPTPLANELGLDNYEFFDYPHPVPVDRRPVFDLGFERMVWSNIQKYPNLFKFQARAIAKFIKEYPPEWRGLIMCASYFKVRETQEALAKYFPDRLYSPPPKTKNIPNHFMQHSKPGSIAVGVIQVWGQGLDFSRDKGRFSIIESVPFGNLTDPFERERKKIYGAEYAWWLAYTTVPQGIGRTTHRGEKEPNGDWMLKVGALADGSAMTQKALGYYPKCFTDSIVRR